MEVTPEVIISEGAREILILQGFTEDGVKKALLESQRREKVYGN